MSAVEVLDRETYPVEVCDEKIAQAQRVLADPAAYTRREFFDARRALMKWTRRREAAIAWRQVKHAAEFLFDFASRMPGFWQHDLTSPARSVFIRLPGVASELHARSGLLVDDEDQPLTQCDKCRRKSWDIAEGRCGMVQPDGSRCDGRMEAFDG